LADKNLICTVFRIR